MSRIRHVRVRRLAGFVAGLASALLAAAITAPAALAVRVPPPGGTTDSPPVVVHTRTLVHGGMPGWQIAAIAAGAAVVAATAAVLIDRARLRRRQPAPAAQPAVVAGSR